MPSLSFCLLRGDRQHAQATSWLRVVYPGGRKAAFWRNYLQIAIGVGMHVLFDEERWGSLHGSENVRLWGCCGLCEVKEEEEEQEEEEEFKGNED